MSTTAQLLQALDVGKILRPARGLRRLAQSIDVLATEQQIDVLRGAGDSVDGERHAEYG
jgi:hypothetical protein